MCGEGGILTSKCAIEGGFLRDMACYPCILRQSLLLICTKICFYLRHCIHFFAWCVDLTNTDCTDYTDAFVNAESFVKAWCVGFLNTDCTDNTDKSLRLGDSCYLWDSCLFLFYWRVSLLYPHTANPLHHHVPEWSSLYGIQDAFARGLAWGVRIRKRRESRSRSYSSAYHLSGLAWETGTSPKLPSQPSHISVCTLPYWLLIQFG